MEEQSFRTSDYEVALLGFIIAKPDERMPRVHDVLPDESFFQDPVSKSVYATFCRLYDAQAFPSDPALIVAELAKGGTGKQRSKFKDTNEAAQWVAYALGKEGPFNPNEYIRYAEYVRWSKLSRDYRDLGQRISTEAGTIPYDRSDDWVSEMQASLDSLALEVHQSGGLVPISQATSDSQDFIEMLHDGRLPERGVDTGIGALDDLLGGLNPGEVIVLAAATGGGKTTASMYMATHVAQREHKSVMIFSLEMMNQQLVDRLVAQLARVSMDQFKKDYMKVITGDFREGTVTRQRAVQRLERQYRRIRIALDYINTLPIELTTQGELTVADIRSMIIQKKHQIEAEGRPEVGLIVIDYLQIIEPGDKSGRASRSDQVQQMTHKLKQVAKEVAIPIVLLSQINRAADDNAAPELRNLRESGSIEQDADKVIFLWGKNVTSDDPAEYQEYDTPEARGAAQRKDRMRMHFTVAKNRQGTRGDVEVVLDYDFQTFASQNTENRIGPETFDEFFNKYYAKTRKGEDLFWPLVDDEMVPGMLPYRSSEIPELSYVMDNRYVNPLSIDFVPEGQQGQRRLGMRHRDRSQGPAFPRGAAPGRPERGDAIDFDDDEVEETGDAAEERHPIPEVDPDTRHVDVPDDDDDDAPILDDLDDRSSLDYDDYDDDEEFDSDALDELNAIQDNLRNDG